MFTAIPAHGLAWRLARDRACASANRFAIFPAGLASGFAPPVRARARVAAGDPGREWTGRTRRDGYRLGLVRLVGAAVVGSSGQGWRG